MKRNRKKVVTEVPVEVTQPPQEDTTWYANTPPEPITGATPIVSVYCDAHRHTCIGLTVGRKNVEYIPMDASGLHVQHCGIEKFVAEWSSLPNADVNTAAKIYLQSYAALHYISEKARAYLEEISIHGAFTTIKEIEMSKETTVKKTATIKPAAKTAKATKPAAKVAKATKPVKAAPKGKPTVKAEKPRVNSVSTSDNMAKLKKLLQSGVSGVADLAERMGMCKKSVRKLMANV